MSEWRRKFKIKEKNRRRKIDEVTAKSYEVREKCAFCSEEGKRCSQFHPLVRRRK